MDQTLFIIIGRSFFVPIFRLNINKRIPKVGQVLTLQTTAMSESSLSLAHTMFFSMT